jgi:hypothetical protein
MFDKPLGLPEGSIRALLALTVVGATVMYLFINKSVPTELVGVLGAVVGFYFGSRKKKEA